MQVFEFHFNPKLKPDLIFDSFCYEPENIYERRVGSLYMAGVLKNVLPQNLRFLDNLAKVVKERYYTPTLHSPEKSLKESLQRTNDFLERIAKSGNVNWLGNLSFAILSLRNFELNFAKVGDFKIFLVRGGQIIDIDRKLRFQEIEPYPLKIFGNIVSGKLAENDVILVLTRAVIDYFQNPVVRASSTTGQGQNLLNEIAKLLPFNERGLREILNKKRGDLSKISGICLVIFLSKEILAKKRETILPQPKEFSLKEVFSPIVNYFKKLIKKPRLRLLGFGGQAKLKLPKIVIPKIIVPKPKLTKNQIIILALIFSLVIGFFATRQEEKQQLEIYQNNLNQIQEKVNQAESFLILKETKPQLVVEANSLLKESWEEISPIAKIAPNLPSDFSNQVFALRDKISKNLYQLNNLVEISEPEIIFEFNPKDFVPQKMVSDGKNLYFFSPYSQNLFKVNQTGESQLISIDKKFNLATSLDGSILFSLKPNQVIIFRDEQFGEIISLETPGAVGGWSPDFNFNNLFSYRSNLYFLDKKTGEIIKYPYLKNFEWGPPRLWLDPETKKAIDAKSLAVDGDIWILNKVNSISRYRAGKLQETLKLDFFPYPKEFSKIFTLSGLSYLYILEPIQKRIIILTKAGEIIKQFQSEKFDNLLDFSISQDGKIIWLLNGLKVYQINL